MTVQKIAVVGAGPVGCITAAFLSRGGHPVTLCEIVPDLLSTAKDPGIVIEGAETLRSAVSHTTTRIDELASDPPDAIIVTAKATSLHLIASAIQAFHQPGMLVVSWQNGIDTELVLAESLGRRDVIRGVVNYGCSLVAPGHVHMAFHHPPHCVQELDPASKSLLSPSRRRSATAACPRSAPTASSTWCGARRS